MSDDEYTPTTEQVRSAAGDGLCFEPDDPAHANGCPGDAAFDRWLAAHDREVAARALRDFRDRVYNGAPDPYQAFYDYGLAPLLDAEADRIEAGEGL